MCGDNNRPRKRKILHRAVRHRKRNMFARNSGRKCAGVVETEDVLAVINQQIEVVEEVSAEDATDTGVCGLELCDLLNYGEGVGYGIIPGIERIEVDESSARKCRYTAYPVVP
jgi:hypothetical protein